MAMKKLEEIPKNDVFKVPDGYFDRLPGIIQARVATREKVPAFQPLGYALRFALPAVVLIAVGIFWFNHQFNEPATAESILATIQTDDLVAYLNTADFTTEELLDHASLDSEDASQIEEAVFGLELDLDSQEDLEELFDDLDLNSL
jgi:hypothetical protein